MNRVQTKTISAVLSSIFAVSSGAAIADNFPKDQELTSGNDSVSTHFDVSAFDLSDFDISRDDLLADTYVPPTMDFRVSPPDRSERSEEVLESFFGKPLRYIPGNLKLNIDADRDNICIDFKVFGINVGVGYSRDFTQEEIENKHEIPRLDGIDFDENPNAWGFFFGNNR